MRLVTCMLATFSALVYAHPDPQDVHAGMPKFFGGSKFIANLKARNIFAEHIPAALRRKGASMAEGRLEARLTSSCGPGIGSCDAGYCCSAAGYCGQTEEYCAGPDCQFEYGPACDANKIPTGPPTSSIARPHIGSIPYGGINTAGVQDCIEPGVIAFSFDDGPYLYTKDLLDLLDSYGAKATFFITGNNLGKGEIDDCSTGYPQLIKRMYNSGHQVASHTWTHQDLSSLTKAQFDNQMYYNEMALRNILGVIPTYMRPPYSSCSSTCSKALSNMGYHVTYFDLDTEGYLNDSPDLIQNSKTIFTNAIRGVNPAQNDLLLIEHDIHFQTVYNLTRFMLDSMKTAGWDAPVTVGTCLGDPTTNWYRSAGMAIATCVAGTFTSIASTPKTTSTSSTNTKSIGLAAAAPLTVSTDGSCGGTFTCQGSMFGNCCSQHGWCGSSSSYCGTGCQASFGNCGVSSLTSTSKATPMSSSATILPTSKSSSSSSSSSSAIAIAFTITSSTAIANLSSITDTSTATSKYPSTKSTTAFPFPSPSPSPSSSSSTPLPPSQDGSCGPRSGVTCRGSLFGTCCSPYGWCGASAAYCGAGCQPAFGSCA